MNESSHVMSWVGCPGFSAIVIPLPTVSHLLYTNLLKLVIAKSYSEFSSLVLPVFILHLFSAGNL